MSDKRRLDEIRVLIRNYGKALFRDEYFGDRTGTQLREITERMTDLAKELQALEQNSV